MDSSFATVLRMHMRLLTGCSVIFACLSALPVSLASGDTKPRPVVYQLVVRHFGNDRGQNVPNGTITQNGVGKFSDINDAALREIKKLNVSHIWLTGVLRQSTLTDHSALGITQEDPDIVKGRAGSFFAIRDLFDVSPDYADNPEARLVEFRQLVQRIHSHDMKVMIDLVGNHVSRSYDSIVRPDLQLGKADQQSVSFGLQNNFVYLPSDQQAPLVLPRESNQPQDFVRDGLFPLESGAPGQYVKATGNRLLSARPGADSWYETVVLNYGYDFVRGISMYERPTQSAVNTTWEIMDEFVRTWTMDFGVDGFRADFAHWVPTDHWKWLISNARSRKPELFFVAEAYEDKPALLQAGFDAVYDDPTYDLLKGVTNKTATPALIESHWYKDSASAASTAMRYIENHDERRVASPVVVGSNPDASGFGSAQAGRLVAPLAYLSSAGPILIYNGQTEGESAEGREGFDGDNGRTSIFDYWQVPTLAAWKNGGSFDGGGLTTEQMDLQNFYRSLTKLAQYSEFRNGRYFGLNFVNRGNPGFPGNSTLAFARYLPGSRELLIVLGNWSDTDVHISLELPDALLQNAGIQSQGSASIAEVRFQNGEPQEVHIGTSPSSRTVTLKVAPKVTQVFRIAE
jgi:glycosidase